MNLTEYAKEMGISKPSALDHVRRLQWETKDGRRFQSSKTLVKGKTVWNIKELSSVPTGEKSLDELKKEKMIAEIAMLRQRNGKMRSDLMRDWTDCMYNAFIIFFGSLAGRITAMRLPQDQVNEINKILKEEVDKLQSNVDDQIREYEEANNPGTAGEKE